MDGTIFLFLPLNNTTKTLTIHIKPYSYEHLQRLKWWIIYIDEVTTCDLLLTRTSSITKSITSLNSRKSVPREVQKFCLKKNLYTRFRNKSKIKNNNPYGIERAKNVSINIIIFFRLHGTIRHSQRAHTNLYEHTYVNSTL